jgi:single-strand DNA-binding protein
MGRLTKEPELSYTSTNNTAICKFTLAVDRRFVPQGGERQADFIPVVAWRKLAEFCSKYFSKGLKVVIVGSIQTRNWDDNEGKRHYSTEVVADEAYFAESKKAQGNYQENYQESNQETSASPVRQDKKEAADEEFNIPDDFDDDGLPF